MYEPWLLILAIAGILISAYILFKKKQKKPLVCMIGDNKCNEVVTSKFGELFGFDNTILGLIYYGFVAIYSIIVMVNPSFYFGPEAFVYWAKVLSSGGASIFSVYLVYVQLGVLKKICEYCLASAAVTIAIFVLVLL